MKTRMISQLTLVTFSLLATSLALGDTVYLKNGAWIDGIVRSRNAEMIQVEIGDVGKLEIPLSEIYEIEKNSRTGSNRTLSVEGRAVPDVEENGAGGGSSRSRDDERDVDEDEDEDDGDRDEPDADDEDADDEDADEAHDDAGDADDAVDPRDQAPIDPELRKRIEELIADLRREKAKFRVRAQRHLKAVGPPAIPFLLPVANDPSDLVRTSVFRLLDSFGDERAIPACLDALTDANEFVRDYAHRALLRITKEDFGYRPFASPRRREQFARKWKDWWDKEQAALDDLRTEARRN